MQYETYEVYTINENGDDYYVDLCVAVQGLLECGFAMDDTIYVFSCADCWYTLPDGSMEYGTPAGFEPQLIRTLTIADAIRETGCQTE